VAKLDIREARLDDLDELLAGIRPADLAECDALFGPGHARQMLETSLQRSVAAWAAEVPGKGLMCLFGMAPISLLGDQGVPWMIGTGLVDRHPGAFIRASRPYISRMLALCPQLVNVVDARNVKSIAYLKRMGFTILPAAPTGAAGLPFHPFFLSA
jgi:hypothetical protein